MTRQIALGLALGAVFSVGTATVLVHHSAPATTKADEVCIVLAKDANHHHTQDYCIDWTSVAPH